MGSGESNTRTRNSSQIRRLTKDRAPDFLDFIWLYISTPIFNRVSTCKRCGTRFKYQSKSKEAKFCGQVCRVFYQRQVARGEDVTKPRREGITVWDIAENRGRDAFLLGKTEDDCPYEDRLNSKGHVTFSRGLRNRWLKGFRNAATCQKQHPGSR